MENLPFSLLVAMRVVTVTLIAAVVTLAPFSKSFAAADDGADAEALARDLSAHIGEVYHVTTKESSEFFGSLREVNAREAEAVFETKDLGRITLPLSGIRAAVRRASPAEDRYWPPNPNRTRYFFSPTAIPLRRGEGYYQNTYLFLNSVNVGVTDHLSLGGGFEFLSVSVGHPIYFLSPKAGYQLAENFHMAGGLMLASIDVDDPSVSSSEFGVAYGLATYGDADDNVTLGAGYGFMGRDLKDAPIVSVGGAFRMSERIGLITENWLFRDSVVFSYGLRFMSTTFTVDLALVINRDIARELPLGFPFVDFVIMF